MADQIEVPVEFRVQLKRRFSFDKFGRLGQSLSSIIRESLTGGAFDTASSPEQKKLVAFEFQSARSGSLVVAASIIVGAAFWEVGKKVTEKIVVDTLTDGIKKYLNPLLGRKDTKEPDAAGQHDKLLEQINRSLQTLAQTLSDVEASGISVRVAGREALQLDISDIEALTVEPMPWQDVVVSAYPLSLHSETGKGWLRITEVPDGEKVLRPSTSRAEIDESDRTRWAGMKEELGSIWHHNNKFPRDKRTRQLVVTPFISKNGLVRNVKIVGMAQ